MDAIQADPDDRRILVVHPGAEMYGSDRMAAESVAAFVAAGHEVVVALPGDGPLIPEMRRHGARVVIVPMAVLRKSALRPLGMLAFARDSVRSVPATLRLLRRRPGVVYVSTQILPSWTIASRLAGGYTVCHVHEAERHPNRFVELGLNAPLLFANRIIANSEYSAAVLHSAIPRLKNRTTIVRNGVAGPGPAEASPPRQRIEDALRVVYVGRLSPRKGVHVAVRAVRGLHERGFPVRLRIVGEAFAGYEWFERKLLDDAGSLVGEGVVSFGGFMESVWPELREADVAVVPSTLPEPFGNTAVEARLAARPVVASGIGGLPEAVSGGAASFVVPPGDADKLANALVEVASRWAELRVLAISDAATAKARFSTASYRRDIVAIAAPHSDAHAAPVRVLHSFPDPRPTTNPYIVQLARALTETPGIDVLTFSWRRALREDYDVFHVHWPEALLSGSSRVKSTARAALFALLLLRLQRHRVTVVRTAHNLDLPDMAPAQLMLLRRLLGRVALTISLNEATPRSGNIPDRLVLHGHYRDWWGQVARSNAEPGRIAFVGLVRRYKGVEELLRVFSHVDRPNACLAISGRPTSDEIEREVRSAAAGDPRVDLDLRHLDDAEFVRAVTRAQLVVLPYRFMHNSGSTLAALSLDRPVLVPRNAATTILAEEVGPGWVCLYDGDLTPAALAKALDATESPPERGPDLSRREWGGVGLAHLQAYRQALAACAPHRTTRNFPWTRGLPRARP